MVSSEHRTGLFVTVPLYFVVLACCAIWANRKNRQEGHQTDRLSSHYLGGRSIGPLLSAGTVFASFFSGYTIVGIPTEAFKNGFLAFRWVAMALAVVTGMSGTVLRLRKAALVRNHKTPVDFVTDRFQSQILRYTLLVLQIVPSLFYTTAQVIALKTTCNSIFGLPPDTVYPVLLIVSVTLMFEWIGGLRCVAMTDCIQASIMIVAYFVLPLIIVRNYGGWQALSLDTYPRPDFYQTPSWEDQMDFWQFALSTFTFFTLPHLMQRAYAARDLVSLRTAYVSMTGGMWLLMFGGVFIGTVGVAIVPDDGEAIVNPLAAILEEIMNLGGFPLLIGLITITASLAAIMSTVDSLLVAISQLVTEEVAYPLYPNATPDKMAWVGRAVSFVAIVIATVLGLTWDDGITHLANINFQLSFQTLFIFMIGLFATPELDCHPWSLAAGAITSTIYIFCIYFAHIRNCDNCGSLNAGITGILFQLGVLAIAEGGRRLYLPEHSSSPLDGPGALIFPNRPSWDLPRRARFGEKPLTPKLLWKMMEGTDEALTNPWYGSFMFVTISIITPFVAGGLPRDTAALGETVVNGLPWWAVKMFFMALIPTLVLLFVLVRMPNKYMHPGWRRQNSDEENNTMLSGATDPDVMELTREELGHRTEYDGRNELVYRRRMQILEKLGISPTEIDDVISATRRSEERIEHPVVIEDEPTIEVSGTLLRV
ncbi:Sodium/proline symporter [Seminavis robusta]|uniref:Sodium/proline symporter n=1 Tax=Seminavis robusta TaxID=568900 RepID=A0A9N8DPP4_9STRA|nr:Sodium/proline symporter [Seminavis robusta]|eukprot:Sro172_g076000.1 Sodium/proline symporter (709) ;mRNA; f:48755-51216